MKTLTLTIITVFIFYGISKAGETIRVTTWNLEWFPNGSPRQLPVAEQQVRIQAAAEVIRKINPDVLLLQEVKNYQACAALVEAIGHNSYQIAVCSAFKVGRSVGNQQQAILTKVPAMAAWSEEWKALDQVDPPRGFTFAWLRVGKVEVGFYNVHLKSNLITRGDTEKETSLNISKRESATSQMIAHLDSLKNSGIPALQGVIIGGDFNTNVDQEIFSKETTLKTLTDEGFKNIFEEIHLKDRITHPASRGYPDATFDYLFVRGMKAGAPLIEVNHSSDHLPVTSTIEIP